MEIRYSCNQRDFKRYTTEETRKEFLIENLYAVNEVVAVYKMCIRDRSGTARACAGVRRKATNASLPPQAKQKTDSQALRRVL